MTQVKPTKGTLLRYAIGASVLLLGLMAFSAICWFTCTLCAADDILSMLGFWELVIVGAVSFFAVTSIRSLQRRRRSKEVDVQTNDAPTAEDTMRVTLREKGANWRSMYAQLSRDEREKLKAMVGKYYDNGESDTDITQPLTRPDDSRAHSH